MPLFKVDIEKRMGTEYWSNVYYVEAADLAAAHAIAFEIKQVERAVHATLVTFTKYRTSDLDPNTDLYVTTSNNEAGLRVVGSTEMLPLFNVARFELSAGAGRPSRKYLRGVLSEAGVSFDSITAPEQGFLDANYSQPMELITELRDVDNQPIIDVQLHPYVGMRQLRRGSRRRLTPIIP